MFWNSDTKITPIPPKAQIATTAGEVLAACEKAQTWAVKRYEEYSERLNEFLNRRQNDYNAWVERTNNEYNAKVEKWKSLPFWKKWFVKKPQDNALWYGDNNEVEALKFEYDISTVTRILNITRHWKETLKWLPAETPVVLDEFAASAIGLGVACSEEENKSE